MGGWWVGSKDRKMWGKGMGVRVCGGFGILYSLCFSIVYIQPCFISSSGDQLFDTSVPINVSLAYKCSLGTWHLFASLKLNTKIKFKFTA